MSDHKNPSRHLNLLLNRCLTDTEFCQQILHQPEIALAQYNLSEVEREAILNACANSLVELVTALNKANLIHGASSDSSFTT